MIQLTRNDFITVTMEWRFPRITETADLDAQDELRAHVSRLRDDFELAARILGCEPDEIPRGVQVDAKIDFVSRS